jgi:hypothetical protein
MWEAQIMNLNWLWEEYKYSNDSIPFHTWVIRNHIIKSPTLDERREARLTKEIRVEIDIKKYLELNDRLYIS